MITFLGDVYLADGEKDFCIPEDLGAFIFNFEYAYYGSEFPHALNKALLKSRKDISGTFPVLPAAVDINNNHIFDYGQDGVASTMDYLTGKGIPFFGSGRKTENCSNPIILECDHRKIALMGYYHRERDRDSRQYEQIGQAFFSEQTFLEDVARARAMGADVIIPSIHWGVEHSPGFTEKQQRAAHFMVDNGADLIIGHHPHCIQPIEIYNGKYIFYSLGNFAFNEIYTKSWYTDNEHSQCMHCKRWHRWSRESLGACFDVETGEVRIRKFYQKGSTVKDLGITSEELLKKYRTVKNVKPTTFIRKVILAFSSFTFFKGHIFYLRGFLQMVSLFFAMHIKGKNMHYPE